MEAAEHQIERSASREMTRGRALTIAVVVGLLVSAAACLGSRDVAVGLGWIPLYFMLVAFGVVLLALAIGTIRADPLLHEWVTRGLVMLLYTGIVGAALLYGRPAWQTHTAKRLRTSSVATIEQWRTEHGRTPTQTEAEGQLPQRVLYAVDGDAYTLQFADETELLWASASWVYDSRDGRWRLRSYDSELRALSD